MQLFSWSDSESLQSTAGNHPRVEKRYSLDNENFDFHSPLEILCAMDEYLQLVPGAKYYSADFALIEPECFDQVDEFLNGLEMRFFEKFEHAKNVYFKDADTTAKTALKIAVEAWIAEYIYVEPQWCMVDQSDCVTIVNI
ncbi:MAG: hypothetical protein V4454_14245 [Pseudomonadota bacterium]